MHGNSGSLVMALGDAARTVRPVDQQLQGSSLTVLIQNHRLGDQHEVNVFSSNLGRIACRSSA
jgi:hypothetical protein